MIHVCFDFITVCFVIKEILRLHDLNENINIIWADVTLYAFNRRNINESP